MMTLITGATGFIGRRLLRDGDLALVRGPAGFAREAVGDLADPASLHAACRGIDTVLHCAGYAHAFSDSDPDAHWRINCEGTRNLLAAAVACGVRRFVFLSSVKAMAEPGDLCVDEEWCGAPATPYGLAKRAAEELVLAAGVQHGMHVVNLRLAMVYGRGGRGNLERMARGIRAGWFPPLPETGNRRSLVHVDDVVAAVRLVASMPQANGRTYIVADRQSYSGQALYAAIRQALGMPPARWQVPASLLAMLARGGDAGGALLRRSLSFNSEVLERLLGSSCYSSALIERELGWRAHMPLSAGLLEMLDREKDS